MAVRIEPIPCSEEGCTLPAGHVMGALIMIESRHHGKHHTTVLSIADLRKLLDKAEATLVR